MPRFFSNLISDSAIFILVLIPLSRAGNDGYVNSSKRDVPTTLSSKDFLLAQRMGNTFEQNFDPSKAVRLDLLEGDIKGLTGGSINSFTSDSNQMMHESQSTGNFVQHSAIRKKYNLWPNGEIPYLVSNRYSSRSRSMIAGAIQDFQDNTCIKFVPRNSQRDYIYITPMDGCFSSVGRDGGRQIVSIDNGCFQRGTIIHEIMHAAGFFHEQNRNDRDSYVEIRYENIMPGLRDNFAKRPLSVIDHLGTPYDYGSVMHYGTNYFSRNGRPTIVPKQSGVSIGQRRGFSTLDIDRLNKLYNCPGRTSGSRPVSPPARKPWPGPSKDDDRACYHRIPDAKFMLRVEEGCYRVVKYVHDYIVTYCTNRNLNTEYTQTSDMEYAKLAVENAKGMGVKRCRGPGNIPEKYRRRRLPSNTGYNRRSKLGGVGSWIARFFGSRFDSRRQGDSPETSNFAFDSQDIYDIDL